jgi:hypothetical protein
MVGMTPSGSWTGGRSAPGAPQPTIAKAAHTPNEAASCRTRLAFDLSMSQVWYIPPVLPNWSL